MKRIRFYALFVAIVLSAMAISSFGWYVKAYGALFIPESVLGNATLDIANDDASGKQIDLNAGSTCSRKMSASSVSQ